MNKKMLLAGAVLGLLLAAGAAGAWYWRGQQPVAPPPPAPVSFVTLDKVIVMLRADAAAGSPPGHYMALELVFRTTPQQEAELKAVQPYLKSLAVRALSSLHLQRAGSMGVDDYHRLLQQAYRQAFAGEGRPLPFSEVMISKLIIE